MRSEEIATPVVWINDKRIDGVIEASIEAETESGGVITFTLRAAHSDRGCDRFGAEE